MNMMDDIEFDRITFQRVYTVSCREFEICKMRLKQQQQKYNQNSSILYFNVLLH